MELRIKDILNERGMTMKDLASELGWDQSNFSKMLKANPTMNTLEKIANALNVGMSELFSKPEQPAEGHVCINGEVYLLRKSAHALRLPLVKDWDELVMSINDLISKCLATPDEDFGRIGMYNNSVCYSIAYHGGSYTVTVMSVKNGTAVHVIESSDDDNLVPEITKIIADPARY